MCTVEHHCVVYHATLVLPDFPDCVGAIIDNNANEKVRCLKATDREDKAHARQVFKSFFPVANRVAVAAVLSLDLR